MVQNMVDFANGTDIITEKGRKVACCPMLLILLVEAADGWESAGGHSVTRQSKSDVLSRLRYRYFGAPFSGFQIGSYIYWLLS